MSPTPHLEIRGLRKSFRGGLFARPEPAIDGLTCAFPRGRCTGLLGHNGAGKTTTIRSIFGMIRPDAGEILYDGRPLRPADKARIGYIPEVAKLPSALTPLEILGYQLDVFQPPILATRGREALIREALEKVGLWEARKKRVTKLSKGMARRLAWAQATFHDPELIILDEPFSGLDPTGERDVRRWLTDYRAKGVTMIVCMHRLWLVDEICDDYHILRRGRLVSTTIGKDATEGGGRHDFFELQVADESQALQAKAAAAGLPGADKRRSTGGLSSFWFRERSAATAWLRLATELRLDVRRFTGEPSLEDERLMACFEGDRR